MTRHGFRNGLRIENLVQKRGESRPERLLTLLDGPGIIFQHSGMQRSIPCTKVRPRTSRGVLGASGERRTAPRTHSGADFGAGIASRASLDPCALQRARTDTPYPLAGTTQIQNLIISRVVAQDYA